MATLTVRDLDDTVRDRLRIRAAQHGQSMAEEVRRILTEAVSKPATPLKSSKALYARIRERFEPLGGIDIPIPARETMRDPDISFD